MARRKDCSIQVIKDGPYMVTGDVPLFELIINQEDKGLSYLEGKTYPVRKQYALCRCGKSKNMPYCDGTHACTHFDGTETASRESYLEQAERIIGPELILLDLEGLCAFARFCHEEHGDVWTLTEQSDDARLKEEAIRAACNCPAGRLVMWDRETNRPIEPKYEPSIVILQDPSRSCSGPLWVRGGIEIYAADGTAYEIRNRVTLCRCGHSRNMPYCDAMHVPMGFSDGRFPF